MKGATFKNDLQKLIYNGTAIANIADNAAASPLGSIYWALHTADPGGAGSQNTSECSYGNYARQAVARTTGGHTVTGDSVSPVAAISFPASAAGSNQSAMFWSTGVAVSGATKILDRGPIGSVLGPFTAAVSDTITIPGLTGLAVDDRIVFYAAGGSSLPTGITEGTVYWVKTVSGDAVTISTTQGGATLDITAVGDGVAFRVAPINIVGENVTPQLTTASVIKID